MNRVHDTPCNSLADRKGAFWQQDELWKNDKLAVGSSMLRFADVVSGGNYTGIFCREAGLHMIRRLKRMVRGAAAAVDPALGTPKRLTEQGRDIA